MTPPGGGASFFSVFGSSLFSPVLCFRTLCVFGAPGVRPECPRPAGSARTDSRTPGTLVFFCDLFFGNLCALILMVGQWDRLSRPPIPRVGTRLESARTGVNACACVFGAAFFAVWPCCMNKLTAIHQREALRSYAIFSLKSLRLCARHRAVFILRTQTLDSSVAGRPNALLRISLSVSSLVCTVSMHGRHV